MPILSEVLQHRPKHCHVQSCLNIMVTQKGAELLLVVLHRILLAASGCLRPFQNTSLTEGTLDGRVEQVVRERRRRKGRSLRRRSHKLEFEPKTAPDRIQLMHLKNMRLKTGHIRHEALHILGVNNHIKVHAHHGNAECESQHCPTH